MSKRYKEIEGLSESQLLLLSFAAYKCTPLKADRPICGSSSSVVST